MRIGQFLKIWLDNYPNFTLFEIRINLHRFQKRSRGFRDENLMQHLKLTVSTINPFARICNPCA
jgi:hypothetical protein